MHLSDQIYNLVTNNRCSVYLLLSEESYSIELDMKSRVHHVPVMEDRQFHYYQPTIRITSYHVLMDIRSSADKKLLYELKVFELTDFVKEVEIALDQEWN